MSTLPALNRIRRRRAPVWPAIAACVLLGAAAWAQAPALERPAPVLAPAQAPATTATPPDTFVAKCVGAGGSITYTNGPCPEGSEPVPIDTVPIGEGGTAIMGPAATAAAARSGGASTRVAGGPASTEASCAYLRAESERLGKEAKAPKLPEPVRAGILQRVDGFKQRMAGLKC